MLKVFIGYPVFIFYVKNNWLSNWNEIERIDIDGPALSVPSFKFCDWMNQVSYHVSPGFFASLHRLQSEEKVRMYPDLNAVSSFSS